MNEKINRAIWTVWAGIVLVSLLVAYLVFNGFQQFENSKFGALFLFLSAGYRIIKIRKMMDITALGRGITLNPDEFSKEEKENYINGIEKFIKVGIGGGSRKILWFLILISLGIIAWIFYYSLKNNML